jgi:hypothetical protein
MQKKVTTFSFSTTSCRTLIEQQIQIYISNSIEEEFYLSKPMLTKNKTTNNQNNKIKYDLKRFQSNHNRHGMILKLLRFNYEKKYDKYPNNVHLSNIYTCRIKQFKQNNVK